MQSIRVNDAIEETMQFIRSINRFLEKKAPWKLINEDKASAGETLFIASEALCVGAKLLHPIMPNRGDKLLETLGAENTKRAWGQLKSGTKLKEHTQLFPRIDNAH